MSGGIDLLKKNLDQLKAVYHRQRGEQAKLLEKEASLKQKLEKARQEEECLEQVRLLLLEAAKHAREQGRRQVELMVLRHCSLSLELIWNSR